MAETDRGTIDMGLLDAIGEAIQEKLNTQAQYVPAAMPAAILSIPTGITPTGTISITQNGTVDVTQYASAAVNVQPNLQSKTATQNGTVTPDSGYDGLSSVVVNVQGGDVYSIFLSANAGDYTTGWYGSRTISRILESGPKLVVGNWRWDSGYSCGAFYTLHDYGDIGNVCVGNYAKKHTLAAMDFSGYGPLPIYAYGGMDGSGADGNSIFYLKNVLAFDNTNNANTSIQINSLPVGQNCWHGPTTEENYGVAFNSMSDELKSLFKQLLLQTL